MAVVSHAPDCATDGFRHEAVLYHGIGDLLATVVPFVREGLDQGEPVLVAMPKDRVRSLADALGADAARVQFVDMVELGANPACIIPEWRRFLDRGAGRPVRGIGEPVWAGRRDVEIDECALHESLLNVAFDEGPAWRLLCPYDVDRLPARALEEAQRTHPVVGSDGERGMDYQGHGHALSAFAGTLTAPPPTADTVPFAGHDLAGVRDLVRQLSRQAGVPADAAEDLVLAAHELATNSITHGGGSGVICAWREAGAFVVEVRDSGTIVNPLVGRELSSLSSENGRGVWMANQLCDLVQVRSTVTGTVVRLFAWVKA
ncbi:MAG TPA: sensor histidine kinase [Nocardioidaceae bacterium]|nr:sensor histidine kinase [Nocardioidaceae bacterium]